MNTTPPIEDKLAEAIMTVAEGLKAMAKTPDMKEIVIALIMGSKGSSKLKRKDVEFIVNKIYDLAREYKADEIIKLKKLFQ